MVLKKPYRDFPGLSHSHIAYTSSRLKPALKMLKPAVGPVLAAEGLMIFQARAAWLPQRSISIGAEGENVKTLRDFRQSIDRF